LIVKLRKISSLNFTDYSSQNIPHLKMKVQRPSLLTRILAASLRTVGIVACLYVFILSLSFLSTSFRIIGGRNLSSFFSSSELLSNPIVGLMIGILVTVLVQVKILHRAIFFDFSINALIPIDSRLQPQLQS